MLEGDVPTRLASIENNKPYVDHQESTLWLITWGKNRTFYTTAATSEQAIKKGLTYIASEYKLPPELFDYVKRTILVEESNISWP